MATPIQVPQGMTLDQCLAVNQLDELKKISAYLQQLNAVAVIGTKRMDVFTYTLAPGVAQKILAVDPTTKPRKVLIVIEPTSNLADATLAISPSGTASADVGPLFGLGTSHDFGVIPGSTELWAQQKPSTLAEGGTAAERNVRVWVLVSV